MSDMVDCELPTAQELVGAHAQAVLDQAAKLCHLPRGWDGSDSLRVSSAAATAAVKVAMKVTCPECLLPVLSPTLEGNVLLDWTYGDDHVEIEVAANGRLEVLVNLPEYPGLEFTTTVDDDDILGWLAHQITAVGISRFSVPT